MSKGAFKTMKSVRGRFISAISSAESKWQEWSGMGGAAANPYFSKVVTAADEGCGKDLSKLLDGLDGILQSSKTQIIKVMLSDHSKELNLADQVIDECPEPLSDDFTTYLKKDKCTPKALSAMKKMLDASMDQITLLCGEWKCQRMMTTALGPRSPQIPSSAPITLSHSSSSTRC